MRRLHPVGFTTELDGLIFSTRKGSKSGSFVVAIGEELMEKLREADRLRNGAQEGGGGQHNERAFADERDRGDRGDRERDTRRPQSSLTPREIQARLRAGRTIDEVAREAGVGHEWVERFAAPILAEQGKVIELAQGLKFVKSRLGESSESLGESVAVNLLDRGVRLLKEEFDAGWSAYQLHDRIWTVRFEYRSRARQQQATWELDASDRSLVARDRLASDLGYLAPGRHKPAARAMDAVEQEAAEAHPTEPPAPVVRKRTGASKRTASTKARTKAAPAAKTAKTAKAAKSAAGKLAKPAKAAKAAKASKPAKAAKALKAPKAPAVKAAAAGRGTAKRQGPLPRKARVSKAATKAAATPASRPAAAKRSERPSGPAAAATKKSRTPAKAVSAASSQARPSPPRIGTDGTQLTQPRPQPARRRASPPRSAPPAAAPSSPRPASPRSAAAARPAPERPGPEERQPPRRVDTNARVTTPRAAAIVERLEAIRRGGGGSGSAPPFEPGEPGPARPPGPAAAERRREPPAIAIGPRDDRGDERDKGDEDAFVIRPRISAKQASELADTPSV